MTPTVPSLAPFFEGVKVSAFRFETRERYALTYEAGMFADFTAGRPIPDPSGADWFRPWLEMIRTSPAAWSRVRIVDEPPTDYQRFNAWAGQWNTAAGEAIYTLPRSLARAAHIHMDDWWMFDSQTVIRLVFDDRDDVTRYEVVPDSELGPYFETRDIALALVVPGEMSEAV